MHFLQTKAHKVAFLELAHLVASADGFVNRKEQGYIRSYMEEMNIEQTDLQLSGDKDLAEILENIKDEQVKNIFFAEILLLIFADGDFNDDEKQIEKEIQQLFGFSDETYETYRNWVSRMDKLKIEGVKLILSSS